MVAGYICKNAVFDINSKVTVFRDGRLAFHFQSEVEIVV